MMKKTVFALFFVLFVCGVKAQETPCQLTESTINGKQVLKGERNYMKTEYDLMRVCVQFVSCEDRMFLGVVFEPKGEFNIDSTNLAYVQLLNGNEHALKPEFVNKEEKTGKVECWYLVDKQTEKEFADNLIVSMFFSSREYPQIEVAEMNRYIARKIMTKIQCMYNAKEQKQ